MRENVLRKMGRAWEDATPTERAEFMSRIRWGAALDRWPYEPLSWRPGEMRFVDLRTGEVVKLEPLPDIAV